MIETSLHSHIGRITLNRPDKHNALDRAAMAQIVSVLDEWEAMDIRAVILTGTGKSFCAGALLAEVAGEDWGENPLTALCDRVEAFKAPTICALNGGVYGGGVELALACDFRIGVKGMKMFVPPARLGIHYEPAGIRRAMDRLGAQMARRVFLLAERFGDEALLDAGFLDELVEPDALESAAQEMAEELAGMAPLAVQGMKRSIVELSQGTLDEAAAKERIATCFASEDHHEGLAAQAEKRKPAFKGR